MTERRPDAFTYDTRAERVVAIYDYALPETDHSDVWEDGAELAQRTDWERDQRSEA